MQAACRAKHPVAASVQTVAEIVFPAQVGVIRLSAFNARAQTDVAAAVKTLTQRGATEFTLDVRDNRGGLVSEGIEVAKLFLPGTQ